MTSPYGPSGGNDPQQWGQQPYGSGPNPGTPSGGFPAQGQPGGFGQPAGYGQGQYGVDPAQAQQGQAPFGQPAPGQAAPGQPVPGQPAPGQPAFGGVDPNQAAGQYPGYGQQQPGQPFTGSYGQPAYGQQPQPGFQGGFGQYGGMTPPDAPKKKSALPWILTGAVVLVVAVVLVLGFVWPGFFLKRVFDHAAVQDGVKKILTSDYKLAKVEGVTCPADQPVKTGETFDCQVKVDGKSKKVPITVRSDNGEYEVGLPK
ncbi:protein of unknown function (DUF4333) [Streptoalloteichus tenebrarius]|uniref:DUF4333 domain-containing protein n=1 Tax=Streptoalloteichus tenebrarius (strain ATCC 17920 / DSM 40477 / JCM 4838 / CBS 697.72 / NBRC 16177 / NCIMB 11028 / NRRL B-12390 / A12253. 1 / ISP 5477) TaxID=1933 RepID=A0ABT1HPB7_STRSD|nr:DUF4333 domain-containing protein [Streptoalloteichus tenebrarius]MCP2257338.1 protein of unknown function (DUF4333) [Streptoalloteichus tenebrarius]BFF04247.1 DUF4333 domain-containing protein [Streptoalloteichus tenebrarius]